VRFNARVPTTPADHRRAVLQLVLAAVLWSLGGLLIKSIAWPALAVSGGRGLIAALFLALTCRPLRFTFSRLQVLGALGYAGCTITFVAATKYTTAANAILLQYTAPVWVALFGALLLGERTSRLDWTVVWVVLAGMGLFLADGLAVGHLLGDGLGLLSGVCFAGMTLALRAQKDGSPVESIILGNLIAFAIGLPAIVGAPALPAEGWFALILLGAVQLGCSYWLYARAIRHVTALQAVLIPVIEPLCNPLWVLLALGERPTPLALLGGLLVLLAVTGRGFLAARARRRTAASYT
jgi:drug/metabolite transporter (DMT)-like permease